MFGLALTSLVVFALAASLQVNAHAAVSPALGVRGTPVRNDVKRPGAGNCGAGVNVASALASSQAVTAAANGTFKVTGISFNGGGDGSRSFAAKVDTTGKGTSFTGTVTLSQNGQRAPSAAGSEGLTAKLPVNTKCLGGKCIVQFVSTAGFGNCVVVQQAGGAAAGNAGAASGANTNNGANTNTGASANTGANTNNGASTNTGASANTGANTNNGASANTGAKANAATKANKGNRRTRRPHRHNRNRGRTIAARELLAELEGRDIEIERRGFMDWVWA